MGSQISLEDAALPPPSQRMLDRRPSAVCFSPEAPQIKEIPSCSDLSQLEFESVYMTPEDYSQIQEDIHSIVEQNHSPLNSYYGSDSSLRGLERELSQVRKTTATSIVRTMVRYQDHKDPEQMAEFYGNFSIQSVYEAYSTALLDEEQVMRDIGRKGMEKSGRGARSSFLSEKHSLQ